MYVLILWVNSYEQNILSFYVYKRILGYLNRKSILDANQVKQTSLRTGNEVVPRAFSTVLLPLHFPG